MNFVNQSKSLKPVVFILVAVLLFTATFGNAFAADSGALTSSADAETFDPDPGIVPHFVKVSNINFKVGSDIVFASVRVLNQSNQPVGKALVTATWTFPKGNTMKLEGHTDGNGLVFFVVEKATGENKLQIEDVRLEGLPYNPDVSQTSGTVKVSP